MNTPTLMPKEEIHGNVKSELFKTPKYTSGTIENAKTVVIKPTATAKYSLDFPPKCAATGISKLEIIGIIQISHGEYGIILI